MPESYIKRILNSQVYDVAIETPVVQAHLLSKRLGNRILIKREDLQDVFSFKIRGAYNCMAKLTPDEKRCGVVAASAGNHAQGVALSAKKLGISAKIVMPKPTPEIKINSVRERGAEVVLFGDNFDQSLAEAKRLQKLEGRIFIHPYDDPEVIAGQGTIGMEILRQISGPLDAIFIPVGGGGLIAGIAAYIKYLRRDIKIIGVESEGSACLKAALDAGMRVRLPRVDIFADGVAVAEIGEETFRVLQDLVDDVITVSNDEICAAVRDLFQETRAIAEPAGALALAGLKKYIEQEDCEDQTMMCVMSGANMDFRRLPYISERADVGEKKEGLFWVRIPERAGSFKTFISLLQSHNITEFNYRLNNPQKADVFVGVDLKLGRHERDVFIERMLENGYDSEDLTEDEVVKEHVRRMIGGHLPKEVRREVVYRIEFPERHGALMHFLAIMDNRWDISLFHYKNRGGVATPVLLGVQLEQTQMDLFEDFLKEIDYPFESVTDNAGYRIFLSQRCL